MLQNVLASIWFVCDCIRLILIFQIPNGLGFLLGIVQLVLFWKFPQRKASRSAYRWAHERGTTWPLLTVYTTFILYISGPFDFCSLSWLYPLKEVLNRCCFSNFKVEHIQPTAQESAEASIPNPMRQWSKLHPPHRNLTTFCLPCLWSSTSPSLLPPSFSSILFTTSLPFPCLFLHFPMLMGVRGY